MEPATNTPHSPQPQTGGSGASRLVAQAMKKNLRYKAQPPPVKVEKRITSPTTTTRNARHALRLPLIIAPGWAPPAAAPLASARAALSSRAKSSPCRRPPAWPAARGRAREGPAPPLRRRGHPSSPRTRNGPPPRRRSAAAACVCPPSPSGRGSGWRAYREGDNETGQGKRSPVPLPPPEELALARRWIMFM